MILSFIVSIIGVYLFTKKPNLKPNFMFTKISFTFLFCLSIILNSQNGFAQKTNTTNSWSAKSPNGNNKIIVSKVKNKLFYTVLQNNVVVIKPSALGITGLLQNFHYKSSIKTTLNHTYTMVIGKRKVNQNKANQTIVTFKNNNNLLVEVIFRAYNDGVAFRYNFPNALKPLTIANEITEFKIPLEGKAWLSRYGKTTDWSPAYEEYYTNGTAIDTQAPDSCGWSFPALFKTKSNFILITESDLDSNFYASHLQPNCNNGVYKIAKPLGGEAHNLFSTNSGNTAPVCTPWRTIIFGKSLGTVIESNLVYHLSAPNKIGNLSWVKPGRASWSWWGDHESSKNFTSLKNFVNLAKDMGWEYSLVDANWDLMQGGGTIEDLAKYAKQQNIALALWYNSGGLHNNISERPRDLMNDPIKRKLEFEKLNQWGVKAIKVDFFNSDKQQIIKLYHDILIDAAAYKIMVIFHGCTLPRGWSRTYPNLISMEAIRGSEQYAFDKDFSNNAPSHNVTAICTRNVVGPMDYTPVVFSNYDTIPHLTSNAHELATSVLFESGMLHFADRAAAYTNLAQPIKNFLKIVPVSWDDTKFITGSPGKLIVLARQKGNQWFVAGANGENFAKKVSVNLNFLPKGKYQLQIMQDGQNNRDIKTEILMFKFGKPLNINMLPSGGFTIWIKKLA